MEENFKDWSLEDLTAEIKKMEEKEYVIKEGPGTHSYLSALRKYFDKVEYANSECMSIVEIEKTFDWYRDQAAEAPENLPFKLNKINLFAFRHFLMKMKNRGYNNAVKDLMILEPFIKIESEVLRDKTRLDALNFYRTAKEEGIEPETINDSDVQEETA